MLRALFLAVAALLFSSKICSQNPKNAPIRSLLWEISGPDAARPSYLYGTMHVPEKLAFHLSDSFFVALKSADIVALETDPETWQPFFQEISGVETGLSDAPLRELNGYDAFTADFYNYSFAFEPPSNQVLSGLLSSQPSMANQLLFRSGEMNQDFEEDTYLDMFIYQAGRKLRKPVLGLEITAESYEMAMRSGIPDDPADAEGDGIGGIFDGFSSIQEAYRAQDIDRIDSLSRRSAPSKNHQKWLIDERNAVMCRRLDSLMRGQKTVFAGVGAAHLAGPKGMIPTMRNLGWTMRPVLFLAHAESKTKQEIDDLRLPVALERHFSSDSAWSAMAPGPFFPANRSLGAEPEMLAADMANGAFYAVFRLPTLGGMAGQGAEKMAARLDSLIYENVPGKISERKKSADGPPQTFEITTRTRRGDAQRYRIFVSDEEIFMFVAGGNADWAMGREATEFLNSAKLNERLFSKKGSKWQRFEPKMGGFAVDWPSRPTDASVRPALNGSFSMAATDSETGAFYLLAREFLPDVDYIEEDSFELNYLSERVAERLGFRIAERREAGDHAAPTTDFLMQKKDDSTAFAHGRLVIDGADFWLLLERGGGPKAAWPDRFFSSFERRDWQYSTAFEAAEDSTGNFKITLPKAEKAASPVAQRLEAIQKEIARKSANLYGGYGEASGFEEDFGAKTFIAECRETGERVWAMHEKLPPTDAFPDQDSLQRFVEEKFNPSRSLVFRQKKWSKKADSGLLIGEFLLEDTNSVRGIWAKALVRDREIWQLRATSRASGTPNSKFVATAFSTFEPLGAARGTSLLGERDLSFLDEIFSEDSLDAASAIRKLPFLKPEKGDFARLAPLTERAEFSKLKMADRERILTALARTEADLAGPFFENFYRKWPDTPAYQVAALRGLVNLQTPAGHAAFLKMLDEEPPFLSPSALSDVFFAFRDSLPLAKKLFPKLLDWANYPEFQPSVLDLLGDLVEKGLVKPKMYASRKAELLRDGRRALAQLRFAAEQSAQSPGQNFYEGGFSERGLASEQLLRFARLLAPWAKGDKSVGAFFEKLRRAEDLDFRLRLFALFFDQNLAVADSELRSIFEDRRQRHRLFGLLKRKKALTPEREKWFADELDLARSLLESQTNAGYQNEKWDTIRLISRHLVSAKHEKGELFFFDLKPEKQKTTRLGYVFLPEKCAWVVGGEPWGIDSDFWTQPQQRVLNEYEEQGKTRDELMRSKLASFRFSGRQRVRADWSAGAQW